MVYILTSQISKRSVRIEDHNKIICLGDGISHLGSGMAGDFELLDAIDNQGQHYVVHGSSSGSKITLVRSQPKPAPQTYTQHDAWVHEEFVNGVWQAITVLPQWIQHKFTTNLAQAMLPDMPSSKTARVPNPNTPTQAKFAPAAPINILASLQQHVEHDPALQTKYEEDAGWNKAAQGEWTWQGDQRNQKQGRVIIREQEVVASVTKDAIRLALHALADAHPGKPLTLNLTVNGSAGNIKAFAEDYIAKQGWLITINHPQRKQPAQPLADEDENVANAANIHAHMPT